MFLNATEHGVRVPTPGRHSKPALRISHAPQAFGDFGNGRWVWANIESIGSSTRIEGSKLSDREVEQLLSNLEIKSFATRDEQEVGGYAELIETGAQIGIVFQTASPFDTPRLMTELVAWVDQERESAHLHPLLVIALCVVVFLEIHPFQDGNGRLSRVLTTFLLMQAGYAHVPYSSLESVIEQSKEAYYLALRQTQATIRNEAPNWQPWLVFFLRSMAEQVRRLEKKVERGTLNQHGSGRGVWCDLR